MKKIPEIFKVDFTAEQRDLVAQALDRLLLQHYDKCVLRQFVAAIIGQCRKLYAACLDMQEQRTVYEAESVNLDALGRIVGQDRLAWEYTIRHWMVFDEEEQGFDTLPMWCIHANQVEFRYVDDVQLKINIILKAIKNHTLTSSVRELVYIIKTIFGVDVSFLKVGPNEVSLCVKEDMDLTILYYLTYCASDKRADDIFVVPYPATLNLNSLVWLPEDYMIFDDAELCFDAAVMASSVNLPRWQ